MPSSTVGRWVLPAAPPAFANACYGPATPTRSPLRRLALVSGPGFRCPEPLLAASGGPIRGLGVVCSDGKALLQNKAGMCFGIRGKTFASPLPRPSERLGTVTALPGGRPVAADRGGVLAAAAAIPHSGAGETDVPRLGTGVAGAWERGIGEPGALPGVPAATAGILRAVKIKPRPERRPRLEPAAVAEPARLPPAMGSRALPEVRLRAPSRRLSARRGVASRPFRK